MKIQCIEDPELIRAMGYAADQDRTLNVLHQSDIIKKLMHRLQPQRFKGEEFVMSPRVEAGILFESILERAMAAKFATVRPGEVVSDPIGARGIRVFMSPDGVNPTLQCGEEYKATFMTSRHGIADEATGEPLDKFVHWFVQVKGYAKWLEVLDWIIRVFFVNGNYNRSGLLADGTPDPDAGPCFKSYRVQFTQQEVDANWQMLVTIATEEGLL